MLQFNIGTLMTTLSPYRSLLANTDHYFLLFNFFTFFFHFLYSIPLRFRLIGRFVRKPTIFWRNLKLEKTDQDIFFHGAGALFRQDALTRKNVTPASIMHGHKRIIATRLNCRNHSRYIGHRYHHHRHSK